MNKILFFPVLLTIIVAYSCQKETLSTAEEVYGNVAVSERGDSTFHHCDSTHNDSLGHGHPHHPNHDSIPHPNHDSIPHPPHDSIPHPNHDSIPHPPHDTTGNHPGGHHPGGHQPFGHHGGPRKGRG